MDRLKNKVAVIYGDGGVGSTVAKEFANEGAYFYLAGRTTEFSDGHKESLYNLLEKYRLNNQTVDHLRETVREKMMKYNFYTMIWEWECLEH